VSKNTQERKGDGFIIDAIKNKSVPFSLLDFLRAPLSGAPVSG